MPERKPVKPILIVATPEPVRRGRRSQFESELAALINRHSLTNATNTPDFILAGYLGACLRAYNEALDKRAAWFAR